MGVFAKIPAIVFFAVALVSVPLPAAAQSPPAAAVDAAPSAPDPSDQQEPKPEFGKIDEAGSKVGEKIGRASCRERV